MTKSSTEASTMLSPVFHVLRENKLGHLLNKWLDAPELEEVVLVCLSFDPSYPSGDENLARKLELLGPAVDVTLITVLPDGSEGKRRDGRHIDRLFARMLESGVRILVHDKLHAKVYLFRRGDRVCWVVGSSNLTLGGLSKNTEVNVAGYRQEEYSQIVSEVNKIKGEAYTV